MTTFQYFFMGVFVLFILLGVLAFSLFTAKNNSIGEVTIWGTANTETMTRVMQQLGQKDKSFLNIAYVEKPAATYVADIVDAMASGKGPDLMFLSQDQLQTFNDKILTIPYSSVSQSTFTSSYIFEGQLFLTSQGSLALPFLVDPLVLYWNRDLVSSAGIVQPPTYWDDLLTEASKLTVLDGSSNIKKSAIALGSWDNVSYAKQILTTLIMQAGDPLVQRSTTGSLISVFGGTPQNAPENPATSALQFYTEFANPSKVTYSWNRALRNSKDAFVSGDLALYVGFASDYPTLAQRNPNLNIGVAVLPQIQGNSTRLTYGQMTGLAIPRTAANPQGALTIAEKLTSQAGIAAASQYFGLPPVRVDVPANTNSSAAAEVFFQSALIARGWLDPSPSATSDIFKTMVESVISNKSLPGSATQEAARSMQALLPLGR